MPDYVMVIVTMYQSITQSSVYKRVYYVSIIWAIKELLNKPSCVVDVTFPSEGVRLFVMILS